ncbi:MAG: 4-hydroxy-3-methylbut-2-enyl diphosphate reductase [Deltaproteobacteria bacterium]|nr:4-hydroxy-3-methylbut-2-enyl diphosphate reductase [Deltaproteobacteria bacterium]
MAVILAKTAGFCMGVKRAVDIVLEIAQKGDQRRIYTYGPLIHNPQTVELLRKRGVFPIESIDDIDGPDNSVLVVRAHGISPEERKAIRDKGVTIVDATCPKVAHVQSIIKRHAERDYTTIIVGDREHPEVNGLLGYAGTKGIVLSHEREVSDLSADAKICVVAQTTQNLDRYDRIVDAVRKEFPEAVVFNTVCDSTERRQTEIKELAAVSDAMIIIGGKNSANTCRLTELSEQEGKPTFHIETVEEMMSHPLAAYGNIAVSAGASTPNWIINRVVDTLRERTGPSRRLMSLWELAIKAELYSAFGAACLSYTGMLLQRLTPRPAAILAMALYVFAMHTLNRFIDRKTSTTIGSFREETYRTHQKLYIGAALISLGASLFLALTLSMSSFLLLLTISVLGILYNTPILLFRGHWLRLKDLPGSKNLSVALAWGAVGAILPALIGKPAFSPATVVAFLFIFAVVFIRSSMSDLLDIQSDRLIGRETIPVVIGEKRTRHLLTGVALITGLMLVVSYTLGWSPFLSVVLFICLFYILICFKLCDRKSGFSGVVLEGILETVYIITGAASFLWVAVSWFRA